jgi:hypothetical protein
MGSGHSSAADFLFGARPPSLASSLSEPETWSTTNEKRRHSINDYAVNWVQQLLMVRRAPRERPDTGRPDRFCKACESGPEGRNRRYRRGWAKKHRVKVSSRTHHAFDCAKGTLPRGRCASQGGNARRQVFDVQATLFQEGRIRNSSSFLPDRSWALSQPGCLPRPAHVSEGWLGFRYFGYTGG